MLFLFFASSNFNAQNLNTKDLSALLEIPYSDLEEGLVKLKKLGCTKNSDKVLRPTERIEMYHPFLCKSLSHESIDFTVHKTKFGAI